MAPCDVKVSPETDSTAPESVSLARNTRPEVGVDGGGAGVGVGVGDGVGEGVGLGDGVGDGGGELGLDATAGAVRQNFIGAAPLGIVTKPPSSGMYWKRVIAPTWGAGGRPVTDCTLMSQTVVPFGAIL